MTRGDKRDAHWYSMPNILGEAKARAGVDVPAFDPDTLYASGGLSVSAADDADPDPAESEGVCVGADYLADLIQRARVGDRLRYCPNCGSRREREERDV